jgi:hypothetical protein
MAAISARKGTLLSGWVIFSAPMASATSACPEATDSQARWAALDAEAQAFSTLMMGLPSRPLSRSATCPVIISCPVKSPAAALPKNTVSTSAAPIRASPSASWSASCTRLRMLASGYLPNRVMPVPPIITSRIVCLLPGLPEWS